MGLGEGLHLRDFLDRVSLLHAVFLCTRGCPPSRITYVYVPELLYSILISFSLPPFVIFRQLAPNLHDPCSSHLDSSITILH